MSNFSPFCNAGCVLTQLLWKAIFPRNVVKGGFGGKRIVAYHALCNRCRFKWFLTRERRGGLILTAMWPRHTQARKKRFKFSSFRWKTMPEVDACSNQNGLQDDIVDDVDDDGGIMNKASTPLEQLGRAFSSNMVTTSSSSAGFSTTFPFTSFQFWAFLRSSSKFHQDQFWLALRIFLIHLIFFSSNRIIENMDKTALYIRMMPSGNWITVQFQILSECQKGILWTENAFPRPLLS